MLGPGVGEPLAEEPPLKPFGLELGLGLGLG